MKLYRIERYEDINSREAPQYAVDDLWDNSHAIGVLVEVVPDYEAAAKVLEADEYELYDQSLTVYQIVARRIVDAALGLE